VVHLSPLDGFRSAHRRRTILLHSLVDAAENRRRAGDTGSAAGLVELAYRELDELHGPQEHKYETPACIDNMEATDYRLPWNIAAPFIAGLSAVIWYAFWKLLQFAF
jgi:hypothetical protein